MEKQMEELKQQLKQQEKLASLGLLSAGIAHEILRTMKTSSAMTTARTWKISWLT